MVSLERTSGDATTNFQKEVLVHAMMSHPDTSRLPAEFEENSKNTRQNR